MLKKNISWLLIGQLSYLISQWGIIIVIARLGTPEKLGQFGLAIAIGAPIFALSNLGLGQLIASTPKVSWESFRNYLKLRILTTFCSLLIIFVVALSSNYTNSTILVIISLGIAKSFESVSDVYHGILQKHELMIYISISFIVRGFFSFVVFSLILYVTDSMILSTLSLAVVWCLVLLLVDLPNGNKMFKDSERLAEKLDFSPILRLAIIAMPLGISLVLISLNTSIPRYLLDHYHGSSLLGYYTAIFYGVTALTILFSALQRATIPRLSSYYQAKFKMKFFKLLGALVIFGVVIGVIGVLASIFLGKWFLETFYGSDYARHSDALMLLMVSLGPLYVFGFLSSAMVVMRDLNARLYITIIGTISISFLGMLLIPKYELLGVVYVQLLVAILNMLLAIIYVSYRLRNEFYIGEDI